MPATEYNFWVYIMASRSLQLYIGFTNNIRKRVAEHKELRPGTYTARYNITRLVHFEHYQYVLNAIARENELKDWNRQKKLNLILQYNPTWLDLSEGWYDRSLFCLSVPPPCLSIPPLFAFPFRSAAEEPAF